MRRGKTSKKYILYIHILLQKVLEKKIYYMYAYTHMS